MTYHRLFYKSTTTRDTSGTGTAYFYGTLEFTRVISEVRASQSSELYIIVCLSVPFPFGHCNIYLFLDLRLLITRVVSSTCSCSRLHTKHMCLYFISKLNRKT